MVTKTDIDKIIIDDKFPDPSKGQRKWTQLVKIDDMKIDNHPLYGWKTDKGGGHRVSDEYLAWSGYYGFIEVDPPEHDVRTHKVVELEWLIDEENHEVIQQWDIVELSEEEQNKVFEKKWKEIRKLRNDILKETDWSQLPDAPVSEETIKKYRKFRSELRDVTEQSNDPFEIKMPKME